MPCPSKRNNGGRNPAPKKRSKSDPGPNRNGYPYLSLLPNELKEMIADSLTRRRDLYRLAQCARIWGIIAIPRLYELDAHHGPPKAIRWAVSKCAARDETLALKVLRKSVGYNADVNAVYASRHDSTALHYAAAYGRVMLVEELLRMGARTDLYCCGASWAAQEGVSSFIDRLNGRIRPGLWENDWWTWSPLAIPTLRNDVQTAKLLIQAGASAKVIQHQNEALYGRVYPGITVWHLLAIAEPQHVHGWAGVFRGDVAARSLVSLPTPDLVFPLCLAIQMQNKAAFDMFMTPDGEGEIDSFANPEYGSPLVLAIIMAFGINMKPQQRKFIIGCISKLIEVGAMVNPPNAQDTPLRLALRLFISTVGAVDPCVKKVVTLLVQHGADINHRPGYGCTALQTFFTMMQQRVRNAEIEKMLRFLVENGGDVNAAPAPGCNSLLYMTTSQAILSRKVGLVHTMLLGAGARLLPGEVATTFSRWYDDPWFVRSGRSVFDPVHYRKIICQDEINNAYLMAISRGDELLFEALNEKAFMPTNGGALVHAVIESGVKKFWPQILFVSFDSAEVNEADPRRGSFLHTLVYKIRCLNWLKCPSDVAMCPRLAVTIAEVFIARGTSTLIEDSKGRLALDLLPDGYEDLRLVLLEAYWKETRCIDYWRKRTKKTKAMKKTKATSEEKR
ncbi:hypothetical protein ED733_008079 [Metarhizium rileyi]|uniref:Ankyrin repeat-containing domain protein n=1 Tax=Metarhizium rileyi (strain RCEF 4871) TaxID=1649241 RepID=A0A5C6GN08_METRR|nr:hypothetical protein ED733_008079 [Metarhizium rileyi]